MTPKRSIFTTSKMDSQLLRQKVRQIISVIPENWHFNSSFVSETKKNTIIEILSQN